MSRAETIAVIGAGMIGCSWAITFARAGHPVQLFDHVAGVGETARDRIAEMCRPLDGGKLLRGETAAQVTGRIALAPSLEAALDGADYVQENTPEDLEIKRGIFREIDAQAAPGATIASSTSALLPSQFTDGLAGASRCMVAHPLNPPHLIPAVEIVPSPHTDPAQLERTSALMASIGQKPVVARTEIEGFIMNRLQGAVLDEAFALVSRGVAGPEDIDAAMAHGLARRWSFMGPFETIDLNAPGGIAGFIARYGAAYGEIGRDRPTRPDWNGALADGIIAARRAALPLEALAERQRWRDARLGALAEHMLRQTEGE
ncbi:MAG: 3-hydroxyacyl-CoA dehydrogenase [Pseudomonadota bacterium]